MTLEFEKRSGFRNLIVLFKKKIVEKVRGLIQFFYSVYYYVRAALIYSNTFPLPGRLFKKPRYAIVVRTSFGEISI